MTTQATTQTEGRTMQNAFGTYGISLAELENMPTLHQGQADDCKIETDDQRVWLSRCTVEDGEPWNNKVTVERRLADGSWVTAETWEAR
jgi:hypothetical protein